MLPSYKLRYFRRHTCEYVIHFINNLVDCEWSDFGEWSECSKSCGGGEKTSNRSVVKSALYGGKECEGKEIQIGSCNDQPCPGINIKKF